MRAGVITLFPGFFSSFLDTALIKRAIAQRHFRFFTSNPRDFATSKHRHIDDTPYGGGPGMVMRPEPLVHCLEEMRTHLPNAHVIAPSAAGVPFSQIKAASLTQYSELIFLCGRYEGIDQRVLDHFVDEEISIGEYVVMGGEAPTLIMLEAILRLQPGVLGNEHSVQDESYSQEDYLEAPQYTRPEEFRGHRVPSVLLSGDHQKIAEWRTKQSAERMKRRTP
ncbi:tRNA (guanosine(37)-N1)-methyltransferase TrmD [bacterium]|nr:tRNA (guanosine(37)-N1)-methyltransferase TrmD [bacterium]